MWAYLRALVCSIDVFAYAFAYTFAIRSFIYIYIFTLYD